MSYEPKKCPHCDEVFAWRDQKEVPHDAKARTSFNAYWMLTWHMQDKHPDQFFVCGRSHEAPAWLAGQGAYWDERGHCSYCGSLKPDILLAAIEDGSAILGATDKNYKLYVELPNPNAGKLAPTSSLNFPPGEGEDGWIEATPENCALHNFHAWSDSPHWFKLHPEGPLTHDKFYFQHFDAQQQTRFLDLYNEGRMRFRSNNGGPDLVPRGFYNLPFFMKAIPPTRSSEQAA